jgi:hypothetical protein
VNVGCFPFPVFSFQFDTSGSTTLSFPEGRTLSGIAARKCRETLGGEVARTGGGELTIDRKVPCLMSPLDRSWRMISPFFGKGGRSESSGASGAVRSGADRLRSRLELGRRLSFVLPECFSDHAA